MTTQPSIKQQILDQVRAGRIHLRSKLSLFLEHLGLDSIGLAMLIIGALAVNLVVFWLRANEAISWFSLGTLGVRAFFEAFPYLWLASAVLAFVAIAAILHRLNLRAKPAPPWFLVALVLTGVGIGSTAAFSQANERIMQSPAPAPVVQRLQRVYQFTAHHGRSGVVGEVVSVSPDTIELTVRGQRVFVTLPAPQASVSAVVPGDRLLIVSPTANQQPIRAINVKKLKPVRAPRVQIDIQRTNPRIERSSPQGV